MNSYKSGRTIILIIPTVKCAGDDLLYCEGGAVPFNDVCICGLASGMVEDALKALLMDNSKHSRSGYY
jgi:hypothetical protein